MYKSPFISPKNLVTIQSIKNVVKGSKLPKIDHETLRKGGLGMRRFTNNRSIGGPIKADLGIKVNELAGAADLNERSTTHLDMRDKQSSTARVA